MVDAANDGDKGTVCEDGREKEEEERQGDDVGRACGGLLLLKVVENELEDEGEERER